MLTDLPLLSLVVWLPILGGFLVLALGSNSDNAARRLALVVSIVTFLVSLPLWSGFDTSTAAMQFQERVSWIPSFNIYYHLGVDGLSMPLILLGGINKVATMREALAEGFDLVAMGRALLREPDLLLRWQGGSSDEALCVHCNKCMPTIYSGTHCVLVPEGERPGH